MRHRRSGVLGERLLRIRGLAGVLGLLSGAGVVWQASHATFTANTTNGLNNLASGSVAIGSTAATMFTLTTVAPGDTGTVCMGVQYTGTITPTAVKLYFTGMLESESGGTYNTWALAPGPEMDDNLTLLIQVNTADLSSDPGSSCTPSGFTGFADVTAASPGTSLRTLLNTNTSYGAGLASNWAPPTTSKWRTFKFFYTFASTAPNSAMLDGVKFNVVWEAQR